MARKKWSYPVVALLVAVVGLIAQPAAAQAASTSPAPGSQLWLRADVGVTVNITNVSAWADQSGSGRHAVMDTAARQPAYTLNALNSKPVIRFNGAQSLALTSTVDPSMFTIFVVGKNNNPTESFGMILGPGGTSANNQIRWENGSQALVVGTGNNLPATTASIGNTRTYHALSLRYDGTALRIFRDGRLISTRAMTTNGPLTLASVGAYYSSAFLTGDLAEILVYPTALADVDRATTDSYLRTKYALP